jgi:hypothetical protein
MTKNLKVLWEDNADSPLSASNLSKYLETKADKSLLFQDNAARTPNTDNLLKLRAQSVVPIQEKTTWAYFSFNDSYISHDRTYSPTIAQNISFTPEIQNGNKSLAVEHGTINSITDTNFANLNNPSFWGQLTNGSSSINLSTSLFYDSAILTFSTDALGNRVELNKQLTTTLVGAVYGNFSFYYKSSLTGDLQISIEGTKNGIVNYWRQDTETWTDTVYQYAIPSSNGTWARCEIPRINFLQLNTTTVTVRIYSITSNKISYISKPQYEVGTTTTDFCSSFTVGTRANSNIQYSPTLIDLRQGTIDFYMMMKTEQSFSVFSVTDSLGNIVFSFQYVADQNAGTYQFIFSMKDYTSQNVITLSASINSSSYIGKWRRYLLTWNMNTGLFMKSQLSSGADAINDFQCEKVIAYLPIPRQNLKSFYLGTNGQATPNFLNGILNSFKINVDDKLIENITQDFLSSITVDPVVYKLFDSGNEDIIIDSTYLLPSYNLSSFEINTSYLIIINDTADTNARLLILHTTDDLINQGIKANTLEVIGGFNTDSNGSIIYNTVWDIYQNKLDTFETSRFLINGKNSNDALFEIKTVPESDSNKMVSKINSYFTDFVYCSFSDSSGNPTTTFMTVDPSGVFYFDNLSINGFSTTIEGTALTTSNISTMNSNALLLTSNSQTNGEYVAGNSVVVVTAPTVNINSGTSGIITLDKIRFKNNNIYTDPSSDLIINSDKQIAAANIIIDATANNVGVASGNINLHSWNTTISTNHKQVDIDSINIRDNQITNLNGILNLTAQTTVQVNSGSGSITLDNINVNTDTISDSNLVVSGTTSLNLLSTTSNILINKDSVNINALSTTGTINLVAAQAISLTAPAINFIASNLGKIISLDSIIIDENNIYTNGTDFNLKTVTSGNLILTSAGNISTTSTQYNINAASMTVATSGSSIVLDGIKIASTSIYPSSTSDFNLGSTSNINLNASSNVVTINAATLNLSATSQINVPNAVSIEFAADTNAQLLRSANVQTWAEAINSGQTSGLIVTGNFAASQIWNAVYNDLAECWIRDVSYSAEYGQAVVQTLHGVRPSIRRAEKATVGIVSDTFGYVLGSQDFDKDLKKSLKLPIAISGRTKVRLTKKAQIGDELVSYKYGCAIKANWFEKIFKRDRLLGRVDSIDKDVCWVKVY